MIPSSTVSFEQASARREAYEANRSRVVLWSHSSWFEALLGVDKSTVACWRSALAQTREETLDACSRAFAFAAGAEPPDTDAWSRPALVPSGKAKDRLNLSLLDMLPVEIGLQVLCMRALLFRRLELRRTINKHVRLRLSEYAGISLDKLLADAPRIDTPITPLPAMTMPPVDTLPAETLAGEGFALFTRDQVGSDPSRSPLLRLALARSDTQYAWLDAVPVTFDADGSAWLYSQLVKLLGTWSWLFG